MTENLQAVFTLNDSAFARGTDRLLAALSRIENSGVRVGNRLENSFNSPLKSITNLVGGFFAVDKALGLIKQGLQVTSDFERLDAGLNAVSTSSIDFARSQLYLRELSDRLGISYETLASSYRGLKAATNGTVLEGKATEKIFTSVVQAGAALKLSNDEVKGSLLAITQMMSKGTVSAEELRGQLGERLPGAFKLMADALHVSEQELNKMLQTGSVMAADALPKLAAELEKVYGSKALANANSMAGGWTRATDQLKLFTAEFSKEHGIDSFFAKLGNGVANYIKLLRRAKEETGSYTGTVVTDPTANKQKEIFAKYSTAQKQNYIGYLARQIRTAEGRSDSLAALDPTEENSKKSIAFENYIKSMRTKMATYRKMLNEEYAENESQARIAASKVSDPIALLEKAKDRFKYLTDLKAGLSLQGKSLPSGQATELDKLTKQLQDAGVKKGPKAIGSDGASAYEINARILNELKDQGKSYALTNRADFLKNGLPASLLKNIDLFERLQKSADDALERFDHPKAQRINQANAFLGYQPVKSSGLALPSFDKPESMRNPNQVNSQVAYFQKMVKGIGEWKAPLKSRMEEMQAIFDTAVGGFQQTFASAGPAAAAAVGDFVNGMIQGTAGLEDFPKAILGVVGDTLRSLATTLAAAGTAMLFVPGLQAQGLGYLGGSVALFAAAGAAQAAAQPKRKQMAKGGTLSGPTDITAGEYPGASRRPEWVSPVDVGADLIAERIAKRGGMGGMSGTVVFEIAADRLRGVLQHGQRSLQSLG